MASLSAFSISRPNYPFLTSYHPSSSLKPLQFHHVRTRNSSISSAVKLNKRNFLKPTKLRAVAEEEETLVTEEETLPSPTTASPDQAVSVAVSPSDVLTMFFQAEGTMTDASIPIVTNALKEVEGIADLKVQIVEGIATVELKKQTTIQATGVASSLVETIQGSGFKLQTLNLSFQDEEDFS